MKGSDMGIDALRAIIRGLFPDIPLPAQEDIREDVEECIYRYGMLRVVNIGKVAEAAIREREKNNE